MLLEKSTRSTLLLLLVLLPGVSYTNTSLFTEQCGSYCAEEYANYMQSPGVLNRRYPSRGGISHLRGTSSAPSSYSFTTLLPFRIPTYTSCSCFSSSPGRTIWYVCDLSPLCAYPGVIRWPPPILSLEFPPHAVKERQTAAELADKTSL